MNTSISNNRVVVISGLTGSGKSSLAISLAQNLSGEIISADSVAVYQGFDIGSAKPSPDELDVVKHHLISTLHPTDNYSAGDFSRDAVELLQEVWARKKITFHCRWHRFLHRSATRGAWSGLVRHLKM